MSRLAGKTVFITGGSRGIGREIALTFAREGANIVIAAKTAEPHPSLPGTIYTVAAEIEALGGKVLPCQVDVRDEEQVKAAIAATIERFSGIDILINNASAISLTSTLETEMKRYDLMQDCNTRATFMVSKCCLPHLLKSTNPHILTLSPPLSIQAKWFAPHVAYTISKYGMSLCTLGMSLEFKQQGIAVNSLWPKTTIATAAIEVNFPKAMYQASRKPQIMADAALEIVTRDSKVHSGQFYIDENVLHEAGVEDFSTYAMDPTVKLMKDLFLEE